VGVYDQVSVNVEIREDVNEMKAKEELEKNLREATFIRIEVNTFPKGTLPRQEGKAIRVKDLRDRPDGYKGWLKQMNQK
jgi:phenylacetate-CoA ligase